MASLKNSMLNSNGKSTNVCRFCHEAYDDFGHHYPCPHIICRGMVCKMCERYGVEFIKCPRCGVTIFFKVTGKPIVKKRPAKLQPLEKKKNIHSSDKELDAPGQSRKVSSVNVEDSNFYKDSNPPLHVTASSPFHKMPVIEKKVLKEKEYDPAIVTSGKTPLRYSVPITEKKPRLNHANVKENDLSVHPIPVLPEISIKDETVASESTLIQVYRSIREVRTKFGSEGSKRGSFLCPSGIAITTPGTKWIVDQGNSRIQKFNKSNNFLLQLGKEGSEKGMFLCPRDIAVFKNGNIIVTDCCNERLQVFSEQGEFVRSCSTRTDNDEYSWPEGVAVNSDSVFVSDSWNNAIKVYSTKLDFKFKFGQFGTDPGKFHNPDYLTVTRDNRIVVSDTENERLQAFNCNGVLSQVISDFGRGDFSPRGVTSDFDGNIVFVDVWQGGVHILSPLYEHLKTIKYCYSTKIGFQSLLASPCAVAVDKNGRIYVSDLDKDEIVVF